MDNLMVLIREAVRSAFNLYDKPEPMANYIAYYVANGIDAAERREKTTMDEKLIFDGQATLEDLYRLNQLGFEFVIENGEITNVLHP